MKFPFSPYIKQRSTMNETGIITNDWTLAILNLKMKKKITSNKFWCKRNFKIQNAKSNQIECLNL